MGLQAKKIDKSLTGSKIPVFDSLRKKKWLYPRFNEGCSHFSFCNDMCYIFFVPGFTCLVSLMIVRIDDFVINS